MSGREDNDTGDLVINGSRERPIQKRKRAKTGIGEEQRDTFLEELAATCNVCAAARAAGVAHRTVYKWRAKDAAFREKWEQALDHGYASLEASLLEQARLAAGETLTFDRAPSVGAMDVKLAFTLLQNHQRHRGKAPGEAIPRRSDLDNAVARLEQALKRFAPKRPSASPDAPNKDDGAAQ